MPAPFDAFFQTATDGNTPYDYQRRLACGERNGGPDEAWLASGTPCASRLISIPTGLGKTAAVAWPVRTVFAFASTGGPRYLSGRELLRSHLPLAGAVPGATPCPALGGHPAPGRRQHDFRGRTG